MFKLGHCEDGVWQEHSYPPNFMVQATTGGARVLATSPGGDPLVFETLASELAPPLLILHLLHTPRGEGEAGRYHSEDMSQQDVREFICQFGEFLKADGRCDLWIHSPTDQAAMVWDRHNLVHAYGRLDRYCEQLRGLGFGTGQPSIPHPHPHMHHYRNECDERARALLASREWHFSPLQSGNEQ
jgi:hypothetical protein